MTNEHDPEMKPGFLQGIFDSEAPPAPPADGWPRLEAELTRNRRPGAIWLWVPALLITIFGVTLGLHPSWGPVLATNAIVAAAGSPAGVPSTQPSTQAVAASGDAPTTNTQTSNPSSTQTSANNSTTNTSTQEQAMASPAGKPASGLSVINQSEATSPSKTNANQGSLEPTTAGLSNKISSAETTTAPASNRAVAATATKKETKNGESASVSAKGDSKPSSLATGSNTSQEPLALARLSARKQRRAQSTRTNQAAESAEANRTSTLTSNNSAAQGTESGLAVASKQSSALANAVGSQSASSNATLASGSIENRPSLDEGTALAQNSGAASQSENPASAVFSSNTTQENGKATEFSNRGSIAAPAAEEQAPVQKQETLAQAPVAKPDKTATKTAEVVKNEKQGRKLFFFEATARALLRQRDARLQTRDDRALLAWTQPQPKVLPGIELAGTVGYHLAPTLSLGTQVGVGGWQEKLAVEVSHQGTTPVMTLDPATNTYKMELPYGKAVTETSTWGVLQAHTELWLRYAPRTLPIALQVAATVDMMRTTGSTKPSADGVRPGWAATLRYQPGHFFYEAGLRQPLGNSITMPQYYKIKYQYISVGIGYTW